MMVPPGALGLRTECVGYGRGAERARLTQPVGASKGFQGKNPLKGQVEGSRQVKGEMAKQHNSKSTNL